MTEVGVVGIVSVHIADGVLAQQHVPEVGVEAAHRRPPHRDRE